MSPTPFPILAGALALATTAAAAPVRWTAPTIDAACVRVADELGSMRATHLDTDLPSSEGDDAIAYHDRGGALRAIDYTAYGETGKARFFLCFADGVLLSVVETQYSYNAPIYFTPAEVERRAADGETGYVAFDPAKTVSVEHRYDFDGQRLLEHRGPHQAPDGRPWDNTQQAARILAIAGRLVSAAAGDAQAGKTDGRSR